MLHKALLSSPKEFRVSIGTQTYCTASVNKPSAMPGDLVTVTVRSNTGYGNVKVGVSPSVAVTKVNETTFTFVMPYTNVEVSASASALDFRINVSKTGNGTVTVKSLAKYGETVTVTVAPGTDYLLSSITASGVSLSGSGNTRTFVMPANDVTIQVAFVENMYGMVPAKMLVGHNMDAQYWYGFSTEHGYGDLQPRNGYTKINVVYPDGAMYCDPPNYPIRINGVTYWANGDKNTSVFKYIDANVGKLIDIFIQGGGVSRLKRLWHSYS